MEQVIKIYNPKDAPFGQLSNNSLQFMVIDDKRWSTVTNYILSNMLITPLYRIILQVALTKGVPKKTNIEEKVKKITANIEARQRRQVDATEIENIRRMVIMDMNLQKMDIYQLYNHYLGLEKFENVRSAVERAYNAKVMENKELVETLLSTENRPIHYISGNPELGMGADGKGSNIIGKTLMQIRHNLRMQSQSNKRKDEKSELEKSIFTSYKAYVILQKELNRGDTLKDYIGKSSEQIVQIFLENNPTETLDSLGLNDSIKNTIVQMYNKRQFPLIVKELKQQGYMVLSLRSQNLRKLKERIENKRIQVIVKLYTENVIRENNPHMEEEQIERASEQLLSSLYVSAPNKDSVEIAHQYNKVQNTIIRLYNKGKLPEQLTAKIDESLAMIIIPSNAEIEDAEQMKATYNEDDYEEDQDKDSASTLDENDPIKQMFTSDDKSRRVYLIQRIQRYTGKASNKYRDWDMEKLETYLTQFEGTEATKEPREGVGEWVVQAKHKNNRIELLKTSATKPTDRDIDKIVKKYNTSSPSKVITKGQVFVKWVPKKEDKKIVKIDEERNEYQEFPQGFVKEFGSPLEIHAVVDKNEPQFQELSPIFQKIFRVDGLTYPSVSFYITTMLVSHTGKTMDINKKGLFIRGRGVPASRQILMTGPDSFLDPNKANEVYNKENIQTHKELEETFAKIAMRKKFEDTNLRILLLLTGNAELLWDDPSDIFLGAGTKDVAGSNIVGKILMEIRSTITNIPFPIIGDTGTVVRFMTKDPFMESWINMRVMDMCNTVYKFKQYLYNVDNQDEEIDPNFTTFILDKVFQPCSTLVAMSKNVDIPVPEFFINLISTCQGMSVQITKEYEEEFNRINNEKEQLENVFHNIQKEVVVKKEFDIIEFAKRQANEMDKFLLKNPSAEEKEEFMRKQEALAEKVRLSERIDMQLEKDNRPVKKDMSFEEKQRREWKQFLDTVNESKLSKEEIKKELDKLKNEQDAERVAPVDRENRENILRKQQEQDKLRLLGTISITEEDADKRLEKLEEDYRRLEHTDAATARYEEQKGKLLDLKAQAQEVHRRVELLEKEHSRERKKLRKIKDKNLGLYVFEKMELASIHAKARNELLEKLTEPKLSINDRKKKTDEFAKKQEAERARFYKKEQIKRTREEVIKYEQDMKDIRERLMNINGKKKKTILMRDLAIQDLSKIYWSRIVAMVMFLIQHIKNSNEQDIRRAIASIEMLNSEKFSCENAGANFDNDTDNCIASALSNLLIGIQSFKYQYGEHIPFGTYDIDLAGSIILNQDISDKQIDEAVPENADVDFDDGKYEDDFAVEQSEEEREGGIYDDEEIVSEEREDNVASFGMKRIQPNNNIEQIKIIIREIVQKDLENIDVLAKYFMGMINTIKTYKMSARVKQNRVNFFATLR